MASSTTVIAALDDSGAQRACGKAPPGFGLFWTAIWCGFVVGLVELVIVLARAHWPETGRGMIGMSRHFAWMVPASSLLLFGTSGLLLAILVRWRPRWATTFAPYVLLFQASLSLLLRVPALNTIACALLAGGIAYRGVPWAAHATRARCLRRVVRKSLPALAAVGFGLLAFSLGSEWWAEHRALSRLPTPPPDAPNVLLVVLDTVRADHLSAYGYTRATSPHLSRLAERGVRFDCAIATAPWTLPSHSSLLTGRWPHELATRRAQPLDRDVPTLADVLAARGYSTAGIVANHFFCSYEHGLDRGFAHYEDYDVSPTTVLGASAFGWLIVQTTAKVQAKLIQWFRPSAPPSAVLEFRRKDAARINADALRWLATNRQRPYFLFLNYFDAHDPYLLPRGAVKHFGLSPASQAEATMLRDWHTLDKTNVSAREIALAGDSYDDCIAYLDAQLGRLFDELDRRRLLDNTLVIVTADHGEHLGEHQLFGHGLSLYRPEVHVPLFVVYPRYVPRGVVVRTPVSLRDVPATVAQLVVPSAGSPFPGSSLARFWEGERSTAPSVVLSEVENVGLIPITPGHTPLADGPLHALTTAQHVYIRHDGGREELYDSVRDPEELHDLADQSPFQMAVKRLRKSLDALFHDAGAARHAARR